MHRSAVLIATLWAIVPIASAQVTWQRAYGGFGISEGHAIRETADHGFIVVGSTGSFGNGSSDIYLLKLDSMGERQWSRAMGGASIDQGWTVRVLPGGGYIIAGYTDAGPGRGFDGLVMKVDALGEPQWQRTYGTEGWDFLYDIDLLSDGYAVVGGTYREGAVGEQAWVMRISEDGDVIWEDFLGNEDGTEARSVMHVSDDSLVISGSWGLADGSRDAFVAKSDLAGNISWNTVIAEEGDNVSYSAVETIDGGYALGGFSTQPTRRVMMLAKVNSIGALQWINHVDGGTGMWEGRSIREDYGGGLVLSGITTTYGAGAEDFYMARTDSWGNWLSGPSFGTGNGDQCWGMDMVTDGGYIMVGTTQGSGINIGSVYVVKNAGGIISDPLIADFDPLTVEEAKGVRTLRLSPNPVPSGGTVQMWPFTSMSKGWRAELFDVQGRSTATFNGDGSDVVELRIPEIPTGAYLLRVITASALKYSARLVVQAE